MKACLINFPKFKLQYFFPLMLFCKDDNEKCKIRNSPPLSQLTQASHSHSKLQLMMACGIQCIRDKGAIVSMINFECWKKWGKPKMVPRNVRLCMVDGCIYPTTYGEWWYIVVLKYIWNIFFPLQSQSTNQKACHYLLDNLSIPKLLVFFLVSHEQICQIFILFSL